MIIVLAMKPSYGSHGLLSPAVALITALATVLMLPPPTTARQLTPRLQAVYIEGNNDHLYSPQVIGGKRKAGNRNMKKVQN